MIRQLLTYRDGCTDPHRNLATEAYLTETVPEDTCILYLWQNRHTVVIGRNQNAWRECRTTLLEQEGGVLARRLSGGGAVYHDMGNLNFTFSLPTADYDLRRQQEVLVAACHRLGIPAECSGRNDILTGGRKFSGNSFYHHRGRSFHNGTLLI
ncbi:MAG: lipoate--protein ligase, partial [Oscillospiraceae bacterium]|nr:lipoate--protein ligase [Oscillospiraceae bacterium]